MSLEYSMSVKLLNEHRLEFLCLKGCCTGSSESTLVKIPHCWKSHVTAQLFQDPIERPSLISIQSWMILHNTDVGALNKLISLYCFIQYEF